MRPSRRRAPGAQRGGARGGGANPAARCSSAWRPAPPRGTSPGTAPSRHTGAPARARGGRWYSPLPPRSAGSAPFRRQKSIVGAGRGPSRFCAAVALVSARRSGRPRWLVAPGAGEDPAAALSLGRYPRRTGSARGPAPWTRGAPSGLAWAALSGTSGGPAFPC